MNARDRVRPWFAGGLLLVCAAAAQAQSISLVDNSCVPRKGNGVVRAAIIPDPSVGQSPRLYFRWKNHSASPFYWVPLEVDPGSQYWTVLPRPEDRNNEVEYYAAVVDAAGKVLAKSETQLVKVRSDCRVQLNPREQGVAENLIVGETTSDQFQRKVLGFLCPGLKIRIDHRGVRRSDEQCGPCGIAWLPPSVLRPTIAADDPEASPSRP
jgi:hypothetical protein